MRKHIFIGVLSLLVFSSCKILSVNYKTLPPEIPLRDSVGTIVIVDAAEVHTPGLAITKKREEVVTKIKQDYVQHLPAAIRLDLGNPSVLDTLLSDEEKIMLLSNNATVKQKLFDHYHAAMIIVLKDCSGGFTQDEVVREKGSDGSISKQAYYSVFFQASFYIIQPQQSWHKEVVATKKHSSRSVVSGLLARGPGYEANRKDIAKMSEENTKKTTGLFKEQKVAVCGWVRDNN